MGKLRFTSSYIWRPCWFSIFGGRWEYFTISFEILTDENVGIDTKTKSLDSLIRQIFVIEWFPKLDMLSYSSTYTPRVSFVEENPFASDKSPLKLVATTGQREAVPTGRLSQPLEHVECCKNNAYDQFEQLTPPKYMAQPYDQNATADRS